MDQAGSHPAALTAKTIWVDVEDLFDYARLNPRPSGIQRLAFEIDNALQERFGPTGRVRFVRHDSAARSLRIVSWQTVAALFDDLVRPPRSANREARPIAPRMSQIRRFVVLQSLALSALRDLIRAVLRPARAAEGRIHGHLTFEPDPVSVVAPPTFEGLVAAGDVLLMLGATWFDAGYGDLVARLRRQYQLRTALLVYDLIPIRRPEWCSRRLVGQFSAWFERIVGECDAMFAISRATLADLKDYAARHGMVLPPVLQAVPIGSGFGHSSAGEDAHDCDAATQPEPGTYVLLVATIEARKNHTLMVRVWQHLLETMPRAEVPTLVFAGRVGWLASDLLQRIDNDHRLDGKLLMISDPTDATLRSLYRGCLFTVFPSLYEGWGLPVTESFAFGKPCVCANTTSLPEAGGTLARYFDPDSTADACRAIRETLQDRAGLASWEARIRREFVPVSWQATVTAIVAGLAEPPPASQPVAVPVPMTAQAIVDA